MKFKITFIISFILLVVFSCGDSVPESHNDNYNRGDLLTTWADEIIIPSFEIYHNDLEQLVIAKDEFIADQNNLTLSTLRGAYIDALMSWQRVSMFEIGKAEEINLRSYTNIFPTDASQVVRNIESGSYNLVLPSSYAAQGFPALDYILYGLSNDNGETLDILSNQNYTTYLSDIVDRLEELGSAVHTDWKSGYRESFISNDGSSATASVDKVVNDFLFYYEKFLRAGKIGIPAGIFSGSPIANSVEAPYSGIYTKELFLEGLSACQDFFNGVSHNGEAIHSLKDYMQNVSNNYGVDDASDQIVLRWSLATQKSEALSANLMDQIKTDNLKMLETYDALQEIVLLLKVDMMKTLNIQVDYIDADGD